MTLSFSLRCFLTYEESFLRVADSWGAFAPGMAFFPHKPLMYVLPFDLQDGFRTASVYYGIFFSCSGMPLSGSSLSPLVLFRVSSSGHFLSSFPPCGFSSHSSWRPPAFPPLTFFLGEDCSIFGDLRASPAVSVIRICGSNPPEFGYWLPDSFVTAFNIPIASGLLRCFAGPSAPFFAA